MLVKKLIFVYNELTRKQDLKMNLDNYKIIEIKKCRSCGSSDFKNILSLGSQYLSDFVAKGIRPKKFPLTLILCNSCSLLQLKHNIPASSLYTERYGYKSGINNTMREELKNIVGLALKALGLKSKSLIAVDIGANDGTLLSYYGKDIFRIGVEPVKKFAKECKKYANVVINDFFNYKSYFKKIGLQKAHLITAISCFYDISDPNRFLADLVKILHKKGILVIQQNYLVGMIKQNAFDNIVHEHLEYYSLLSLESLLKRHGLEVFAVEQTPINGGSFRTYIANQGKREIEGSVYEMRKNEEKLKLRKNKIYEDFAKRVNENKKKLYKLIVSLRKKNKTIYIYGASTRGNTLLQFYNLDHNLIQKAVERNSEKWGKKITSVGIPIISEEQGRSEMPDYMLVLPWFFKEEFLKREKRYLDSGGHFIFPLPKIEII